MASGDGNKEAGSPPDFHGTPRIRWGSLLSAIRDQIPSMDSDASLAESDEDAELFLFQRDQSNLIPDLTEELEDLPLEESYLQENISFMRRPQTIWNEDLRSSAFQNEGIPPSESRGDLLLDLRSQNEEEPSQDAISSLEFSINEHQFDEGISRDMTGKMWDLEKEKDTPDPSPGMITAKETPPLLMSDSSQEERRKLIETKILSKAPLRPLSDLGYPEPQNKNNVGRMAEVKKEEAVISAEHPQELTLFRFKDIEKWDLDNILQKLEKQNKATSWPGEAGSPSLSHEHFRAVTQSKLMAKLEELSHKQSKAFLSRWQRCPPNPPTHDKSQGDARDTPGPAPIKNDLSRIPAAFCVPEPPTVYIDLRDTVCEKVDSLTDETQSLSDSSSDDEEDRKGTTQNKEEGMMDELSSASRYSKNCTGKCFLLQQLRSVRKRMSQSSATEPNRRSQNLQKPDGTNLLNVRERQSLKHSGQSFMMAEKMDSSTRSPLLIDSAKGAAKPSGEFQKETKEEICSELPPEASAKKDAKDPRMVEKQQEEHVKEETTRRWLQEQLEKSQPRHSTNGKQPMAEQTPILFHTEASYLAPVSMLPICQSIEGHLLLLTIGLSSCGQVMFCRQPSPVSSGATSAATANIYPAVVTWLLSLVSCPREEDHRVPFEVVGLQQTWEEGALALRVCIVPANPSPTQSSSSLAKQSGTSLFYQQISTFLTQTSLLDVLWWKAELCSHLQSQFYPFLPEIPDVHLSYFASVNSDSAVAEKIFATPAGFYWQTVETDEKCFPNGSSIRESNDVGTEVAMTLLFETLLRNPVAVHHFLQLILASGLDVCGLRLLYPQQQMLLSSTRNASATLALSLRGSNARSVLQDILGPTDPQLARVTDSCSIHALYCSSRAEPLAYSPRTESRVHRELCFWFGRRAPCAKTLCRGDGNPACERNKPRSSFPKADGDQEKTGLQDVVARRLPATLVSTTKGDLILLASPAVPPHSYGLVISTCTERGFVLQGIKQLQLSPPQADRLRMSASQATAFCPCKPSGIRESRGSELHLLPQAYLHCLALLLRKENASLHAPALQKGLMNRLTEKGFLQEIQSNLNSGVKPDPNRCFHVVPYTESFLQELGGDFSAVPSPCDIPMHVVARRRYATDPDLEQVVLLSFTGQDALKSAGDLLHQILTSSSGQQEAPSLGEDSAFELLGLKWLPHLTRIQAKELSPFEVGDKSWQESVKLLTSRPALVCALRRTGAFVGLSEILKSTSNKPSGSNLQRLMSLTPEMAFRQAVLFFTEQELIGDFKRRPALRFLPPAQYVPPTGGDIQGNYADSLFLCMQAGAEILCTLLLIKPGMWSQNLARYLRKLDREKFSLVGMKHTNLRSEVVQILMPSKTEQSPADLEAHSSYLTSGSSLVLCLQRENAVKKLLDLLGPEDPKEAQAINQFFWRALHGHSPVQNGFYGSTSYCAAARDIRLFFPEGLCGATYSDLEEKEVGPVTADSAAHFLGIHKKHRLVKRENKPQFSLLGPKQTQTLEKPRLVGLYQATCLILLEATHQVAGQLPPYLALLEQLMSMGFLLTGAQFTRMTESQARHVSKILSTTTKKEESIVCSQLLKGPCLVLAAERDNAVVSFTTLLSCSSGQKQAGLENIIPRLLYPKTEKQAEELLCWLFDFLTCESIYQIENQAP